VDRLPRLHADEHVVRLRVVLADVMGVVGRDQRNAEFFFQAEEVRMYLVLELESLVLYLEKEIVFAEDVPKVRGSFLRLVVLPFRKTLGDLALQASGERDQSL